jgi:hypothetical protein
MSSTSEISKYRRTWPLAILRHFPIALGASGALGVGWDTPRSIKVGHAPTGTMLPIVNLFFPKTNSFSETPDEEETPSTPMPLESPGPPLSFRYNTF